ncbi:Zinc finger, C2CH-type [Cinara cedri]|uniref:Zinc finger, C2CH-type n=1 Tax=Cinara cedri TaxID=506608 RepID=A0A5E4MBV5_9HEMI|nr:Zinc finger, C2CH-type [Cinara cedri]
MRTCSVPGCHSTKMNSKVTLYKVPCDKRIDWELAVRRVHNKQCKKLKNLTFVCSKHFLDDEIISTYALPSDVAEGFGPRKNFKLKKGAIPSIFNSNNCCENLPTAGSLKTFKRKLSQSTVTKKRNLNNLEKIEPNTTPSNQICFVDVQKPDWFNDLSLLVKTLILPIGWSTYTDKKTVVFHKPVFNFNKLIIEKQMIITDDQNISFFIHQKTIDPLKAGLILIKNPLSTINVCEVISFFDYKQICQGGPLIMDFPEIIKTKNAEIDNTLWRHKQCPMLLNIKRICSKCQYLFKLFKKYKRRSLVSPSKLMASTPVLMEHSYSLECKEAKDKKDNKNPVNT